MKLSFISTAILGVSLSVSAQSWSSINTTTELSTYTTAGPPIEFWSDYEIIPDAITTNGESSNTQFPQGTVFSAYSLGRGARFDYEPQDDGLWLLAFDQNGALQLSKKITVPNSVNVLNENLGDGTWPDAPLSYLTISSLQYDSGENRELLIFTGSLRRPHSENYTKTKYEIMIVGSYNLATDQVQIAYVNQPYTFYMGDIPYQGQVFSNGTSVREIRHNVYMALGHTGNLTNSADLADHPLAVVFHVDGNGAINIYNTQSFEYKFKPISARKSMQDEMVAAGIHYNDQGYQLSTSGATTYIAPALIAFKAYENSGVWSIQMDRGVVTYLPEYSSTNQGWGNGYSYMDLFIENGNIYLSFSERLTPTYLHLTLDRGTGNPVIGKYNLSLTSSVQFTKVQMEDPFGSELRGGVHRLLPREGEGEFDVLMVLDDARDRWQRPNNTSVGIIRIEKSNLDVNVGHGIVSLWSMDQAGATLREVSHVTGLEIGNDFDYYLADGYNRTTSYVRSHVFGIWNDEYECEDFSENITSQPISVDDDHKDSFGLLNNPPCIVHTVDQVDLNFNAAHCSVIDFVESQDKTDNNSSPIPSNHKYELQKIDRNLFRIEAGDSQVKLVALISITGQVISANLPSRELDLNELAPAVYILHFEIDGQPQTERVIVE